MFSLLELNEVQELVRSLFSDNPKPEEMIRQMILQFNEAEKQLSANPGNRAGTVFAFDTWIYAALLDAALHQTDYGEEKSFCRGEWSLAVRILSKELSRIKLLSDKTLYQTGKLCTAAADALRCMDADICGDCIIQIIEQKYGNSDAYRKSLEELDFRLRTLA